MHRRFFISASLLALTTAGCHSLREKGEDASAYRYIDATRSLRPDLSPRAFRAQIIKPNSHVYSLIDAFDDASIASYLQEIKSNPARLQGVRTEFPLLFAQAWERFNEVLPLHGERVDVYVIPADRDAVGGSVRSIEDRDFVILGSDVMGLLLDARVARETFIQHELTHLHHQQVNDEIRTAARDFFARSRKSSGKLYQLMWLEGFAAHVSRVINPEAGNLEVFRSRDIDERMAERWDLCISKLRAHFDSRDHDAISRYVFEGDDSESVPGRAGYYIGSRIAARLAETASLAELAKLDGNRLRDTLYETLNWITLRT